MDNWYREERRETRLVGLLVLRWVLALIVVGLLIGAGLWWQLLDKRRRTKNLRGRIL